MRAYETKPGQHIKEAAREMIQIARDTGGPVIATFNDVEIIALANQEPEDVVAAFNGEYERRSEEWLKSPEGREFERQSAERLKIATEAEAEGILEFSVSNQSEWDKAVKANSDPYGACAVRYAARWANYMERNLAEGKPLHEIAKPSSHEANKEGITGFMYGCAVSVLSAVWEHGEELRRWHNLDAQIRDEGEKANASGGVLNPAVMRIS